MSGCGINELGQLDLFDEAGPLAGDADSWAPDWDIDDWIDAAGDPAERFAPDEVDTDVDEATWLRGLPADVRAAYLAGPWTGAGEPVPAGFTHRNRDGRTGLGFASGGAYDTLAPGPWLAEAITAVTAGGPAGLGESELIGVLCGWRRLSAWAAAGETAAADALARRRAAQSAELTDPHLAEHVDDEIAAALTLTSRSAARLLTIAGALAGLPAVLTALQRGEIDWPKACVFADELSVLGPDQAAAASARLIDEAGRLTTAQLRARLRRLVLQADPAAAQDRQDAAREDTEVQVWGETSGNSAIAGRELPPADVIAADQRLTAMARWLQARGTAGPISQIRAAVYLALLAGQPVQALLPPGPLDQTSTEPASDSTGSGSRSSSNNNPGSGDRNNNADSNDSDRAGGGSSRGGGTAADWAGVTIGAAGWPAVTGTVNLTMPLSAWLGGAAPGEVAGSGPVSAATARDLAAMLAAHPASRWCLTVTGADGRAAGHACARHGPAAGEPVTGWIRGLHGKLQILQSGTCSHLRQSASYQPPASLRHLIEIRQRTCAYPGCRRAAGRCDLDHTVPYDRDGPTCECNLAPLCRQHHRAKQAPGWHLDQSAPGEMTWQLPSGRTYQTAAEPYPA